jgi:hypothetical protein
MDDDYKMELRFISSEHEQLYHRAKTLLDNECARQKLEWDRMSLEFAYYPDQLQKEKRAWLLNHFTECRKPYEKLLTDIITLCPITFIVKVDDLNGTH